MKKLTWKKLSGTEIRVFQIYESAYTTREFAKILRNDKLRTKWIIEKFGLIYKITKELGNISMVTVSDAIHGEDAHICKIGTFEEYDKFIQYLLHNPAVTNIKMDLDLIIPDNEPGKTRIVKNRAFLSMDTGYVYKTLHIIPEGNTLTDLNMYLDTRIAEEGISLHDEDKPGNGYNILGKVCKRLMKELPSVMIE